MREYRDAGTEEWTHHDGELILPRYTSLLPPTDVDFRPPRRHWQRVRVDCQVGRAGELDGHLDPVDLMALGQLPCFRTTYAGEMKALVPPLELNGSDSRPWEEETAALVGPMSATAARFIVPSPDAVAELCDIVRASDDDTALRLLGDLNSPLFAQTAYALHASRQWQGMARRAELDDQYALLAAAVTTMDVPPAAVLPWSRPQRAALPVERARAAGATRPRLGGGRQLGASSPTGPGKSKVERSPRAGAVRLR